ncbi:restriction endonuclease subunit S [Bacteroides acidifaciens]|uniref:restriction endonuclease subunit S n=1 Tax=Bacteroides acidifaciens TaxID=85831 RepID=UPI0018833C5E|nr:restriction endonuclease subunit S [Bacteroides acidifaciens]MBF0833738.1 restriction endonuclease subunit S [Bacteroides acidifaciens]MCR1999262.1 restriction endonuclease subunit S [Bacteroides acidifaciens]
MANNNNTKNLNVPNLRFPEFKGEWKKCTIGELAIKVGSGVTPRGGESVYKMDGHSFVRSQNVGLGHLILDDIAFIDEETHLRQKSTELKLEDVLLNITGASIGRSALVNEQVVGGNVNQHVCIIRTKENLISSFLCNFLLSNYGQRQIDSFQAGGNRQGLNFEQIKSIKIAIPSTKEQTKVAKLLQLIEERIATQSKIIEKYKSLIKGIRYYILEESTHYNYLGNLCDIIKGHQVNLDNLLKHGKYYVMNGGTQPSGYYNSYNTNAGTISISEGGNSCGYVQYNKENFWSGGHCYTLQNIKGELTEKYLYHYLKSNEKMIMALRVGSGLPNIQKKDLMSLRIPIPAKENQKKISCLLDSIEDKISVETNVMTKFMQQKQYLLANLFI